MTLAVHVQLVPVSCPLCQCDDAAFYCEAPSHYGSETYRITRCRRCGMVYTNPQPVTTTYDSEVEQRGVQHYHLKPEVLAKARRTARLVLEELRIRTPGRRVLDFGAGAGAFVAQAQSEGWQATGMDLNRGLVEAARQTWSQAGLAPTLLPVALETFAQDGQRGAWDAVTAIQVFEHMQDPITIGRQLVSLLKPGGVLYVDVPNVQQPGEWGSRRGRTLDPTAHWNHFSVRTLARLVHDIGCDVEFASGGPSLLGLHQRHRLAPLACARWTRRLLPHWTGTGVCVIGRRR